MKLSKWPFAPLPAPRHITMAQSATVVLWLESLPLVELRYRQHVCERHLQAANALRNPYIRLEAVENLQVIQRQLQAAIDGKEFP